MKHKWMIVTLMAALCASRAFAADKGVYISNWLEKGDEWYASDEGKKVITNVIGWQNDNGGWYKSYDTASPRPAELKPVDHPLAPKSDSGDVWSRVSTIDNDATYTELRILARAVRVTSREDAKQSFNKGLQFLFDAQYPNGGWPQRFPLQKNYGRRITFNDGAMVGVVQLMKDIATSQPDFAFVDDATRAKAKASYDLAIECFLKCQVKVNGKLTIWGQQHDEVTLEPAGARSYELPSLCTSESGGITLLLMGIDNPDDHVKAAVVAAYEWFDANKIMGKSYPKLRGPEYEKGYDRKLVDDPSAPPIWARFYSLETGKPMFVDRDGSKHDSVDQVGYERRTGYAWYGNTGDKVLEKFPKWKAKNSLK